MKLSVVTPILNGERFVRATVESVLSQDGDFELEYIIRDGGSTDGTLDILADYTERCTVVSEADGSPQAAINAGMAAARGDVGCWLNADDLLEPGALQTVARVFEQSPRTQWLYGRCHIIDANGRAIRKAVTMYKNFLGFLYSRHVLLCENFVSQPATFWRMDLWRQAGDLSDVYGTAFDYQQWLRMAAIAPPVSLPVYLARFRRHRDSISERHFVRQFREEKEIARAFGGPLHAAIHVVTAWKTVAVYRLMRRLGR